MRQLPSPVINFARSLISFLVLLCALCGQTLAQDFKAVHDGVEHAEVTRQLSDKEPVRINLLRLDLTKVRLDVHHALDAAIGTEKTSSIATRHGAVAAINAGFFRLDTSIFAGDAAGIMAIDGELMSESVNGRIALLLQNSKRSTSAQIGHPQTFLSFLLPGSSEPVSVNGINRERKANEIVLFSSKFGPTTLTTNPGVEIVLDQCIKTCSVININIEATNTPIPKGGHVISIGARWNPLDPNALSNLDKLDLLEKRRRIIILDSRLSIDGSKVLLTKYSDIINGVPQLIKNGKIDITWQQEKSSKAFVETRHPRTAVAKMKDGKFLMMTVDGRQPGVSAGMNLNELAEYLLGLGAVNAMNLDGGGSTTMFLDGKVVNKPSGSDERKVSDAILVTLRKKPAKR